MNDGLTSRLTTLKCDGRNTPMKLFPKMKMRQKIMTAKEAIGKVFFFSSLFFISFREETEYMKRRSAAVATIIHTAMKFTSVTKNIEAIREKIKNRLRFFAIDKNSIAKRDKSAVSPKKIPKSFHFPTRLAVGAEKKP